ncbi:FIST signal transduction protein [Methanocaldococcus sp. 28A]
MTIHKDVIKVGVGQSENPKEAVKEAIKMSGEPNLTIVFSSSNLNPEEIYNAIKEEVGNSAIIGGTTAGEFSSAIDKPKTNTVAVMTIKSPYLKVGIGVGKNISEKPFESGKEAIKEAFSSLKSNPTASAILSISFMKKDSLDILRMKPFVNIVIPDGLSGHEEEFLRGIVSEIGCNVPIIGGSTGDDLKFERTYQFANGVYTNVGVVTTLSSALKIGTGYGHPYIPTKKGAVVTKAKGRVVYELNHRPAVEVMKELLNVDELTPEIFAQNPLGVKSSDVFGEYTIKSGMCANDDGSITFYAEVQEGAYLTLMETNREYAIHSFKNALKNAIINAGNPKKIGAVIIFNCILRHLLNERLNINDMEIIREMLGEVPVIGFNTYGEQGTTKGGSIGHYNQTATILVIGNEAISE